MGSMQKRVWFNPFFPGTDSNRLTAGSFFKRSIGIIIGVTGFIFSLTCIYLAMRGIMKLGGFVATGGPYHIAHHAPNWFWLFPVSFAGGIIFMVFNQVNARRIGGLNLMIWLFPAVFISLGYNFFDFALNPPGPPQGIVWGWLICGITFALMGVLPLILIVKNIFVILGQKIQPPPSIISERLGTDDSVSHNYISRKMVKTVVVILNILSISVGIYLGITCFKAIAS